MNIAVLQGTLSSEPRVTELPSGATVHNYEVTTASGSGERLTVPVAWLDPVRPPKVRVADEVIVVGVVRRRWFRAAGGTQSRTEVVASVVARPDTARAQGAMRTVAGELAAP